MPHCSKANTKYPPSYRGSDYISAIDDPDFDGEFPCYTMAKAVHLLKIWANLTNGVQFVACIIKQYLKSQVHHVMAPLSLVNVTNFTHRRIWRWAPRHLHIGRRPIAR